jgi:hydroxymethylbilane synthase
MPPLRIATRGSRLALRQVQLVSELLGVRVEPVVVSTAGDRLSSVPLRTIAGSGAFAGYVRDALVAGAADLAVHSAKDLPPRPDPRLDIVAFPPRADARDALVGATLAALARGAVVATGAPRRRAQLAALRPDLAFAELRGNIDTRLRRVGEVDAVVVAMAALHRLGVVPDGVVQPLPVDEMVPQVGQGALAVEARRDDRAMRRLLSRIDDASTRVAVIAERAFLDRLGGDCDLPAGAHATVRADGVVVIDSVLADAGGVLHRARARGVDAAAVGVTAALALCAAPAVRRSVSA